MLECVLIQEFLDDLKKENPIELFYISFGTSTVPIDQFTSRDYMRDLGKTTVARTPTVIDHGWTVTTKFQYTELRKFTKVYLVYSVRNQYKLAYVFDALNYSIHTNFIKLDFSDFICNAPISTNRELDNMIYTHRHIEADGGNNDNDRLPPQKDLMQSIAGTPKITKPNNFVTINDFGNTNAEEQIKVDQNFINTNTHPDKQLNVAFLDNFLFDADREINTVYDVTKLDLVSVNGRDFKYSVGKVDMASKFYDISNQVGALKFFHSRLYLDKNDAYLPCDNQVVDPNLYPEYNRVIGTKFSNDGQPRTPDLTLGYIRSSGYMDEITRDGYPDFSQNPAQIKSHNHEYFPGVADMQQYRDAGDSVVAQDSNTLLDVSTPDQETVAKSFIGVWGIKVR